MVNQENAIEVRNVYKYFKVYKDKGHMLRERVISFYRNKYEYREVLKGISFDIKKGESVGLIGKNGCGKSTTLKLLTKILRPNKGTIETAGRVCSLIELGAGFHPDMSGRENIYINASIFGIKAKEVDRRLNDIIRFSELEEFIDNPVRTYSSGMYMRLAFSVAISVDADILLIDEILAVGDSAFQAKCFNKLMSLKEQGTTIVLVSHSLDQVERLCDRAIWIHKGMIRRDGATRSVCSEYLQEMEEARNERAKEEYRMALEDAQQREQQGQELDEKEQASLRNGSCRVIAEQCGPDARREGSGEVQFTRVRMLNGKREPCSVFDLGDRILIEMEYESTVPGKQADFAVCLTRGDGLYCYGTTLHRRIGIYLTLREKGQLTFVINKMNLLGGKYCVDLRIQDKEEHAFDCIFSLFEMTIVDHKEEENGVAAMDCSWESYN